MYKTANLTMLQTTVSKMPRNKFIVHVQRVGEVMVSWGASWEKTSSTSCKPELLSLANLSMLGNVPISQWF